MNKKALHPQFLVLTRLLLFSVAALAGLAAPLLPAQDPAAPRPQAEPVSPGAPTQAGPASLPPEAASRARGQCLVLAKLFEQERFRIRDSHWDMTLRPNESRVLRLNLLGGLRYWLCAGSHSADSNPRLHLYDEGGLPLPPETVSRTGAATGVLINTPYTGSYYVKITNRGEETAAISLMYCYK
jgi:hypothetical protein